MEVRYCCVLDHYQVVKHVWEIGPMRAVPATQVRRTPCGRVWERKFLGFRLMEGLEITIAEKSREQLKDKVRELWRSCRSLSSVQLPLPDALNTTSSAGPGTPPDQLSALVQ